MNPQTLEFSQVSFGFDDWPHVLLNASWHVPAGEFHCLLGRSGCGKTTLLKLAAGLLTPQSGQVLWHGVPVLQPMPDVGFVFQTPTLLHWLSVLDNVLLPIKLHRVCTPQEQQRALDVLSQMGLAALLHQRPSQLSVGQQSRVAIARALMTEPALLLMDEPFAALDALTREDLQTELRQWVTRLGTSVVFVTHDISEAVFLADHVAVMNQGCIAQDVQIQAPLRDKSWRYSPPFVQHCAALRDALDDVSMLA